MNELNELLGLEANERFVFSLEKTLENPRGLASKIQNFHRVCLFSAPTKAHLALKDLAVFKKIRIITENLDCLHETSGIYPYRIDSNHLRNEVGGAALATVDYMICIGLSYDDRGFLRWYKQKNPQGKIIALDLRQPSYLGDVSDTLPSRIYRRSSGKGSIANHFIPFEIKYLQIKRPKYGIS